MTSALFFVARCLEFNVPSQGPAPSGCKEKVTLTAQFKNLGTRTWYRSTANTDATSVRLGIVDPRTAAPNASLPFLYDSGNPLRPALLNEDSIPPGGTGTFTFNLTVPMTTKPRLYVLRVAPVAESALDGIQDWMNRGDTVDWIIQVMPPKSK